MLFDPLSTQVPVPQEGWHCPVHPSPDSPHEPLSPHYGHRPGLQRSKSRLEANASADKVSQMLTKI